LNWWLLFLSTTVILFARKASLGNLISMTMTVPSTYRRQFCHKR
jgi:predicted glutamine amidotransferase